MNTIPLTITCGIIEINDFVFVGALFFVFLLISSIVLGAIDCYKWIIRKLKGKK